MYCHAFTGIADQDLIGGQPQPPYQGSNRPGWPLARYRRILSITGWRQNYLLVKYLDFDVPMVRLTTYKACILFLWRLVRRRSFVNDLDMAVIIKCKVRKLTYFKINMEDV